MAEYVQHLFVSQMKFRHRLVFLLAEFVQRLFVYELVCCSYLVSSVVKYLQLLLGHWTARRHRLKLIVT